MAKIVSTLRESISAEDMIVAAESEKKTSSLSTSFGAALVIALIAVSLLLVFSAINI